MTRNHGRPVRRVFCAVKAVAGLAIREHGLARPDALASVFIPDEDDAATRLPIPERILQAVHSPVGSNA